MVSGPQIWPRALTRSILGDPEIPEMQIINSKINSEAFRPFAPAVLAERLAVYFESTAASPYMMFVNKLKQKWNLLLLQMVNWHGRPASSDTLGI
jgi:carbamoyltransferase